MPAGCRAPDCAARQLVDSRHPTNATLWVGTEPAALFRSDDHDEMLVESSGLTLKRGVDHDAHAVAVMPDDQRVVFAATRSGLWRSDNAGDTFERSDHGIPSVPGP